MGRERERRERRGEKEIKWDRQINKTMTLCVRSVQASRLFLNYNTVQNRPV